MENPLYVRPRYSEFSEGFFSIKNDNLLLDQWDTDWGMISDFKSRQLKKFGVEWDPTIRF